MKISKTKERELKDELEYLEAEGYEKVMQEKEAAGGPMESFHQSASATEVERMWQKRVDDIRMILKNAEIYDEVSSDHLIHIGSLVSVTINKKKQKFKLVDGVEANPQEGCISIDSLIGKNLIEKKLGDEFLVKTLEGKELKIRILEIK